jgi:hypothetical protein
VQQNHAADTNQMPGWIALLARKIHVQSSR